ncbi:hypothetical protein FACS189487_04270 [Campylobacterota bacterium]|nr:hypothetical protein FACS189487_04270 [Campylobacterota bacterium]
MEFSQEFRVPKNIHHLIATESVVGFVDNDGTIRAYDPGTFKSAKLQQLGAAVDYIYFRGNASRGNFLSIFFPKEIKTRLYEFDKIGKEYKEKATLAWSVSATEAAEFSRDSSLLAVGGNNGQVCIYRTDNGKLLTILPKCNEYISSVAFNNDASIIAYSSFKQNLIIYDLDRFTLLSDFLYKEVICALKFMHKTSLIVVGARDNRVFIFDAISGYVVRELIVTISWPVAIYIDESDQYCFVSDKSGYLYMLDLSAAEQEKEAVFNSKSVIVDMKKRGDILYFAFEDGRVTYIDLSEEREKLKALIASKNIAAFHELIKVNPMLKFSAAGIIDNLDAEFDKKFASAITYIAQNKIDAAKEQMGNLLSYPAYQKRFESIARHSAKVATYSQLIQSGQYLEAYTMANEGDFYRKLPLFTMLENRFKERFKEGVANLNSDNPDPKKVKEDLILFMRVPQKENVIKNMLKNPEIFKRAQGAFDKKDWLDLAGIIDRFKILKGAPAVLAYQEMIQKEEEKFIALMSSGRFDEALDTAKFLKENSKADAVMLKIEFDKLAIVENFTNVVKEQRYGDAMTMAIENPFLITSNAYKILDNMLSIRFKAAHIYAAQNRFDAVDKMLRPFVRNKFTSNRAISVYKTLYLEQIDKLGDRMQEKHWINALKNYVCRFGVDSEIELITRKFDREKMVEQFRQFKNANFLRYPIIPNVVTTEFAKTAPKKT